MKLPWQRSEEKSATSMIALSQLPSAVWGRTDAGSLMRDGYAGNAVVYRCVRMIAEAAASIPLRCANQEVASLLKTPSPDEAGRCLIERLYIDLQVTGNAWAQAVTIDEQSGPQGLYALKADCVRVVEHGPSGMVGYAVKTSRGEQVVPREEDGWSPILHLKLYHPNDPLYGLSPLVAARKALDLHNGAAGWAKALIDNAARPSAALIYGKDGARLSDEQFERLKQELVQEHTGASNAGRQFQRRARSGNCCHLYPPDRLDAGTSHQSLMLKLVMEIWHRSVPLPS